MSEMTIANTQPTGVVLDEPMAHALLFAAAQEGLVDNDPKIGDGYVARVLSRRPDDSLLGKAFEHLVLGGKVFIPFWFPYDWHGELFERHLVVPLKLEDEDIVAEVPQMPHDFILGMLAARGVRWSVSELEHRYTAYMRAYESWLAVAGDKSFDDLKFRMTMRAIAPIAPDEYTVEQLGAYERLAAAYGDLQLVPSCIEAYQRVLNASLKVTALSGLSVLPGASGSLDVVQALDGVERASLLQVTCRNLRRVPVGTTLRETIALAQSPEAEDLRQKLGKWNAALRENNIDSAVFVADEVAKVRQSLSVAKTLTRIGEYTTVIGVPLAIAGGYLTGPAMIVAGISVSAIGGLVLVGQKAVERLNRWAMYGQH